jgi:thiol-disulfide isomerase/thioredoxin
MKLQERPVALMASGVILILLGIVFYSILLSKQAEDALQPTDFSAIPAAVLKNSPTLTLSDIEDKRHSISDYLGQVVLINLWATWCPPCKAEMPILQNYYEQHKTEGFVVVGIEDGDPKPDVKSFVLQFNLTFPILLDPTYQATDHVFKTMNLPSSYVLDRKGLIRLEWLGAISKENLEKYLNPLLKEH